MPEKLADLAAATALNDADILYVEQGGTAKQIPAHAFSLPMNYIAGLITSNDTDTDHDIAIAPGVARSADNVANMTLAAILTKQIDAVWAEGDDAGGLDAAPVVAADTLYAIWLIKNPTSTTVDALFSLSFTAPTMPAGYTLKRLIGCVMTDGSANIEAYTQTGDIFQYDTDLTDHTGALASNTAQVFTASAPPNCLVDSLVQLDNATAAGGGTGVGISFDSVGFTQVIVPSVMIKPTTGDIEDLRVRGKALTDSSSQAEIRFSYPSGSATATVRTVGFVMLTRRNP